MCKNAVHGHISSRIKNKLFLELEQDFLVLCAAFINNVSRTSRINVRGASRRRKCREIEAIRSELSYTWSINEFV